MKKNFNVLVRYFCMQKDYFRNNPLYFSIYSFCYLWVGYVFNRMFPYNYLQPDDDVVFSERFKAAFSVTPNTKYCVFGITKLFPTRSPEHLTRQQTPEHRTTHHERLYRKQRSAHNCGMEQRLSLQCPVVCMPEIFFSRGAAKHICTRRFIVGKILSCYHYITFLCTFF